MKRSLFTELNNLIYHVCSVCLKVFDVVLNSHHTVVSNLDIFNLVGKGVAHDEVIPFTIKDGRLEVFGDSSEFDGTLVIEFAKVLLHKKNIFN